MAQIDRFNELVRHMMLQWGDAYPLSHRTENLGFPSKNLLHEVIRHGGAPPRASGMRPMNIPTDALEVEYAVLQIARDDQLTAWVLRAFHCGRGRRNYERFWQANELLAKAGLSPIRRASYQDLVRSGEYRVGRIIAGQSRRS